MVTGDTLAEVEAGSDEERELRGVWLSRLMFGPFLHRGWAPPIQETRSYEEWLEAQGVRLV